MYKICTALGHSSDSLQESTVVDFLFIPLDTHSAKQVI